MKILSQDMKNHIKQEVTTLCTCWEIKRKDNQEFFFTDHDQSVVFEGVTYLADTGYSRTSLQSSDSLAVDNLDIEAVFNAESITEFDMRAGLFDYAEIKVFLLNWENPGHGNIKLRRGFLGEVTLTDQGVFQVELRGLTQPLSQNIGEIYQPECRAVLGDGGCKLSTAEFRRKGSVVRVLSLTEMQILFNDTSPLKSNNFFDGGHLVWENGQNKGRTAEVKVFQTNTGKLSLFLPQPFEIKPSDTFEVFAGCDRTLKTCKEKFNNVINFRGEPFLPGQDEVFRIGT